MDLKISKNIFMKTTALLLSLFLIVIPFFQPKKVKAVVGVDDAILAAVIATGLIAGRYVQTNVLYTPEQMNQINEKWTANLKEAFPDPKDYNDQMNVLQNLNQKLLNGEEVDWSKYSGKALYAVLKGVVDVVWPAQYTPRTDGVFYGICDGYAIYGRDYPFTFKKVGWTVGDIDFSNPNLSVGSIRNYYDTGYGWASSGLDIRNILTNAYSSCSLRSYGSYLTMDIVPGNEADRAVLKYFTGYSFGNGVITQNVPNMTAKTANKVKLPTRLPQTVINNINNYVDNSTENLVINPTPEELPTLPDNYNPVTDDVPDLSGYQDVTPDQQPTTDPEPTPTPPDPTPTPPEYNGDKWVNPIGDFMDGLLKFMKAAFVPTLSLNLDALNSMPDNLSEKFPFSLPGDLIRLFGIFQAEPVPLAFDWEVDFTSVGAGKIPIKGDLSMFNEYAPLFRNLAFIAFIIGLAWKTFGMFFGGGDE